MIKLPKNNYGVAIIIVFILAIVIGGPLATLWALNTLFPSLAIPYNVETWLAAFIIPAALKSDITMKGKQ